MIIFFIFFHAFFFRSLTKNLQDSVVRFLTSFGHAHGGIPVLVRLTVESIAEALPNNCGILENGK